MKRLPVEIAAVILIAGCRHWFFVRPGTQQKDFDRDQHECWSSARLPHREIPKIDQQTFVRCMQARGYELVSSAATDSMGVPIGPPGSFPTNVVR